MDTDFKHIAFIDRIEEINIYHRLIKQIKANDKFAVVPDRTLLINVNPYYSSAISMWASHELGSPDYNMDMFHLETPEKDENERGFEMNFLVQFKKYPTLFTNYIIVNAAINSENNPLWIKTVMNNDYGITDDNILLTTLVCDKKYTNMCDVHGYVYDEDTHRLKFYFEKYNKK